MTKMLFAACVVAVGFSPVGALSAEPNAEVELPEDILKSLKSIQKDLVAVATRFKRDLPPTCASCISAQRKAPAEVE